MTLHYMEKRRMCDRHVKDFLTSCVCSLVFFYDGCLDGQHAEQSQVPVFLDTPTLVSNERAGFWDNSDDEGDNESIDKFLEKKNLLI